MIRILTLSLYMAIWYNLVFIYVQIQLHTIMANVHNIIEELLFSERYVIEATKYYILDKNKHGKWQVDTLFLFKIYISESMFIIYCLKIIRFCIRVSRLCQYKYLFSCHHLKTSKMLVFFFNVLWPNDSSTQILTTYLKQWWHAQLHIFECCNSYIYYIDCKNK